MDANDRSDFDYVVVGSGAGGGPVACNLAAAGKRVLLIEAGGDDENDHYRVPVFHGLATEDPAFRWDYFVRHYEDGDRQRRDSKFVPERDGVLYPRAGTLGSCTAHSAMITVCPLNRDWDAITNATGDATWRGQNMRRYFERLEWCEYCRPMPVRRPRRLLASLLRLIPGVSRIVWDPAHREPSRHGFNGWLRTNMVDPTQVVDDPRLLSVLIAATRQALEDDLLRPLRPIEDFPPLLEGKRELLKAIGRAIRDPPSWRARLIGPLFAGKTAFLRAYLDPNDWHVQATGPQGLWLVPLTTASGRRNGTREYVRRVQAAYPGNLVVKTNALATKVLFDDGLRAVGVEYLDGAHLYRADPQAEEGVAQPAVGRVLVGGEVILAAGAFNTPQLLQLSGVGPAEELEHFGIPVRLDLPGVGENLQDRYEVGVVSEMKADFKILPRECPFEPPNPSRAPDACYAQWQAGAGPHTSSGAVIGIVKKSRPERPDPDLFIFGLPGRFWGYFPAYSKEVERQRNYFTWAILKAQTRNTAGRIALRSVDPRDALAIAFQYFAEGNDDAGEDLESVVAGVEFVRRMMRYASEVVAREDTPGAGERAHDQVAEFVRNEARGHHASCSCKMGKVEDRMAVVDSSFRVHGTENLRVVDASVFPRIPGYFIATAVYMIAEKASDVILAAATPGPRPRCAAAGRAEASGERSWPVSSARDWSSPRQRGRPALRSLVKRRRWPTRRPSSFFDSSVQPKGQPQ